jgi:hypothetical protein
MKSENTIRKIIKRWVIFFMAALVVSGVTAFFLETELAWMEHMVQERNVPLYFWIHKVHAALKITNRDYPFLAYGFDWLAFAHLVIAVAFFGVLQDPIRNKWIIQFGTIACMMIFPLAFIAGHLRSIPFTWQLVDCSFGAVGLIPLTLCKRKIIQLENLLQAKNTV